MPRLVYLAIGFLPSVTAQIISNVVCTSTAFNWAFNSVGDDPCKVTANLAGACNGGVFTLDPLQQGFVYLGPSRAVQNSCRCSSVYYSMLSACAGCQSRNWITWDEYRPNCTNVYNNVFPQAIPDGVRVPAWAYADVAASNGFNVTIAQNLANRPESTAVPTPTSGTIRGTSFTFPPGTSATLSTSRPSRTSTTDANSDSVSSSDSGSNAGAIAGGVIGGIVGLALVAGLLFFFLRRQRRGKPASSTFNTIPYTPAPYNPDPGMVYTPTTSPYPASQSQRLYDPSDPSTFPSTPAPVPSSVYTPTATSSPPPPNISSNTFHGSSAQVGHAPPQMPLPGRYTGAPEV